METLLAPARLVFSPQNLWYWIATSVLLSALVNGLVWRCRRLTDIGIHPSLEWLLSFLREGGRFLYFVGLPYAALVGGLIPATKAGLVNLAWLRDLTLSLPLGLGTFLVLLGLRALIRWREKNVPGGPVPWEPPLSSWGTLRESVYQEIHWAFYRSAPLITMDDRAQAIALGLGIVALEAWLNPAWRALWQDPGQAPTALRTAGLAVLMAVVFGITGNLWVAVGLHVAVDTACGWTWPRLVSVSGLPE
jgi:hypothetical protein